eukprot:NODE_762_length_2781_cov_3.195177.p1 GENE.NODE_762_length_2781_cov_3.195177~~NODE_762_length_2781_cov_3.195177.p1  ORF type:complete len:512 (+),score=172.14 NODE_762_length_2781_cov_3.195177:411-1946(+)
MPRGSPLAARNGAAGRCQHSLQLLGASTVAAQDSLGWWGFGLHDRAEEWLGHGWFWRAAPGAGGPGGAALDNAAGNAAADFDVLEDRFCRLRHAQVLVADYARLRADFAVLRSQSEAVIDAWLLENAAWLSRGQLLRLSPGGDHHDLLGIGAVEGSFDGVVDTSRTRAALRLRSGGRAATFFVGDHYHIGVDGALQADMLDVKGLGTHEHGVVADARVTGLLNFADALRELCYQRLLQRLFELEGLGDVMGTVPFYALLDTGLRYAGTNPATGWVQERCVLAVRRRQSRLFDAYDGMNFSGICPDHVHAEGLGRLMRRTLHRWGLSAEFEPRALFHLAPGAESDGFESEALLADQSGTWNLQADAACTHFMDFSDYYALPRARVPAAWCPSEAALQRAAALERMPFVRRAAEKPAVAERLFGTSDAAAALEACAATRRKLSEEKLLRDAASCVDADGVIQPSKPKYCMCWWLELDDSEVARWCSRASEPGFDPGDALARIEAWLPKEPLAS